MQIESFDQAHRGRCPGCGMVDGGTHIVHRYDVAECIHKFHSSNQCTDPVYMKRRIAKQARFVKWLQSELVQAVR